MNNLHTKIAQLIQENRPAILEAWQQQLVVNARSLVNEIGLSHIRQHSDHILSALVDGLMLAETETDDQRLENACELLETLIQQVDLNNLAYTEITTFVLALKAVLLPLLLAQTELQTPESISSLTNWFDHLTLKTFAVYLNTRDELIREQQRAFMEVSVPVVRLWNKILMIPLVGMLDSSRTQQMMEAMLSALEEYQSKVAILDISGIPVVDTLVARHLVTAASAARLMGAECIITGIRARISQTLVQLGVDLSGFITRSTLSDGLQLALEMTDQQIGSII